MKRLAYLILILLSLPAIARAQFSSDLRVPDNGYVALTSTCSNANTTCDVTGTTIFSGNGSVIGPQTLEFNTRGYGLAVFYISGNSTAVGSTISFEFSDDGGTSWYQNICTRSDSNIQGGTDSPPGSTYRAWECSVGAATRARLRQTAISSGSLLVSATVTAGVLEPAPTTSINLLPAPAQSANGSLQTPITSSATGAASAANATLAGVASKTTYITGFQITGGGATAASIITVTVTGTISGTMNYNIVVPAGATTSITPLIVSFPIPIPASGVNTAIVVNVPSFGAGNTNSATSAQGFQQ